jgi:hypothetical protein
MKIFISHATADRDLVDGLVDLIQLGIGVHADDIFYSSRDGDIRNGVFFVQSILSALGEADLICCILSRRYFASEFCLAEVGAAQVQSIKQQSLLYSLIVPPVSFADLNGVLHGVQSGTVTNPASLNQLRDRIAKGIGKTLPTNTWEKKRDTFLAQVAPLVAKYEAEELAAKVEIDNLTLERSTSPQVTYTDKLRITLKNKTGKSLVVTRAEWDSGLEGVRLAGGFSPLKLQMKPAGKDWAPEALTVTVPNARPLRTWIPIGTSATDGDVLRRCATKRLGSLRITVTIDGHIVPRTFML